MRRETRREYFSDHQFWLSEADRYREMLDFLDDPKDQARIAGMIEAFEIVSNSYESWSQDKTSVRTSGSTGHEELKQ